MDTESESPRHPPDTRRTDLEDLRGLMADEVYQEWLKGLKDQNTRDRRLRQRRNRKRK